MPRGPVESTAPRRARTALVVALGLLCLALGACGEQPGPEDRTERLTGDNGSVLDTSADARNLQATARKLSSRVTALPRSATALPLGPIAAPPVITPPTAPPPQTTQPPVGPTTTAPPVTTTKPLFTITVPEGITCANPGGDPDPGLTLSFLVGSNDTKKLIANPGGLVDVGGAPADLKASAVAEAGKVRITVKNLPAGATTAIWQPVDHSKIALSFACV